MTSADVPQSERFRVDLDPGEVLAAYVRQRRRFAASVASMDSAALAQPTRCHLWSVADVLRHLADVDVWMTALWNGKPPPFTDFDPNVTPHEHVLVGRSMSDPEARDRYVTSTATFLADIDGSGQERWGAFGVSPLGAVPWWMSVLHIFWDSWLHERDVFLPLGRGTETPENEVRPVLTYALLLAAQFIRDPDQIDIAGVRITTGEAWSSSPTGASDPNSPILIDVLAGRGKLEEAESFFGADKLHRLSAMAARLRATPT